MMKKLLTLTLSCAMLLTLSAGTSAQTLDASPAPTLDAGIKLGYASLTGDKSDAFDGAVSGGIFVNYDISPIFAVQGSWLWHKHDATEDANKVTNFLASESIGLPALTDVRLTMNDFDVNGKFSYVMPPVTPYLLAGFGLHYWKVDGKTIIGDFDRKQDETFWDFGINFGGGVAYDVTEQVTIGGEIVYTYIFDEFGDGYFNFLATASYGFSLGGM